MLGSDQDYCSVGFEPCSGHLGIIPVDGISLLGQSVVMRTV